MSEELKILERCERLFMTYGVKRITMDDVARDLGISKKTLYQYFDNKDDLVQKATRFHFDTESKAIEEIHNAAINAIDEMVSISRWAYQHLRGINPAVIYEYKKYQPESWEMFIQHRNKDVYNTLKRNIERGIAEGLYREDVNADMVSKIYSGRLEMLIDPAIFPFDKYPLKDTMNQHLEYHLRAISTNKGIKYLDKIKNEQHGKEN